MTDENILIGFKFMDSIQRAVEKEEFDKAITFKCPICNGEAIASKSSYNGHVMGSCENCKIKIRE